MDLKEGLARNPHTNADPHNYDVENTQYSHEYAWNEGFKACWDYLSEQGVGVLEHDGKRILIKEKSYTGTTLRTTFIPLQEVK